MNILAPNNKIIPPLRSVRSFVCRKTKLSPSLEKAWHDHWSLYSLNKFASSLMHSGGCLDLETIFGRQAKQAPKIVEIGFGDGHSLIQMARENPDKDYIGIEVYQLGIARVLSAIVTFKLTNIRLYWGDAVDFLTHFIAPNSLETVQIFFADPWPKTRHHKRRLIQPDFVQWVANRLIPAGRFHLATDWLDYAKHMMSVISNNSSFQNLAGTYQFSQRPSHRPLTKYEERGHRLGHETWDLIFQRIVMSE